MQHDRPTLLFALLFFVAACGPTNDDTPEPAGEEQSASDILGATELGDGKGDLADAATPLELDMPVESSIDLTTADEVQSRSQLVKVFTIEAEADARYAVAMFGQDELDPRLIVSFDRAPVTESLDFELFPFGRETDSLVVFDTPEAGTYAILALDESQANTGAFRIEAARVEGEVPLDLEITSGYRRGVREGLAERETETRERLTAGEIAEGGDGYLHPGDELDGVALQERAEINRFVDAVNSERKDAYELLAEEELESDAEADVEKVAAFLGSLWSFFR
jgi:uncharacterized protein YdbL (DUF1318 family)